MKRYAWLISLALLGACGGGSGEGGAAPPVATAPLEWRATASSEWPHSSAAAAGLSEAQLDQAFQAGRELPGLYGMLLLRGGALVGEAYYNGKGADDLLQLRSVTKTVMATLIGMAIAEGTIASIDQPIADYLAADYGVLLTNKPGLRIRDLLTMTAGLRWDESTAAGYNDWVLSPDPTRYVLQREAVDPPGQRFAYNSGTSHLLSVVLSKAAGLSTEQYAAQKLFAPLGITRWGWARLGDGYHNGAADLQLRARDLAKLALLWQQGGRWQQQQLVPADWMAAAGRSQISRSNPLGGLAITDYGYLWWLGQQGGQAFQLAWGYGGQFVLTLPGRDFSVVMLNQHNVAQAPQQESRSMGLLVQNVLPALLP